VLALVVGQLAALSHAAAVRHVICEVHGEEIDAPTLVGAAAHRTAGDTDLHGVEGGADHHEDCAFARLLGAGMDPARSAPPVEIAAIEAAVARAPRATVASSLDLVLIAPKTSPPRAG
jgi:hypothetical protein